MRRKIGRQIACIVISIWGLVINLTTTVFAVGELDGVWTGLEIVTVPGNPLIVENTGIITYQQDQNTLSLWDPLFGPMDLVRSGIQWILPSPISITFNGSPTELTEYTVNMISASFFTGKVTFNVSSLGVTATATLGHTKQECQTLVNGATVSSISGNNNSVQCFAVDLPQGSVNLNVQTSGGTGDSNLILVYHRPDFVTYSSDNDGNQEQITVASPNSGKWYIGLLGFTSYSGLSLTASYSVVPAPVPNFTADLQTGNVPLTVTFTDQSAGSVSSLLWDFGDGSTSAIQNPVHTYTAPGDYTVSLTVTGPGGTVTETKTGYIVANEVKTMPWLLLLLNN